MGEGMIPFLDLKAQYLTIKDEIAAAVRAHPDRFSGSA